ncbi:MAG: hypothetical protein NTZ80_04200 [Patescibacteria group bacterium]|nr:hypothetical protein [Patescibacteria group bacterium]
MKKYRLKTRRESFITMMCSLAGSLIMSKAVTFLCNVWTGEISLKECFRASKRKLVETILYPLQFPLAAIEKTISSVSQKVALLQVSGAEYATTPIKHIWLNVKIWMMGVGSLGCLGSIAAIIAVIGIGVAWIFGELRPEYAIIAFQYYFHYLSPPHPSGGLNFQKRFR